MGYDWAIYVGLWRVRRVHGRVVSWRGVEYGRGPMVMELGVWLFEYLSSIP